MSVTQQLRDEHKHISDVLKEFEEVLSQPGPPPAASLFELRNRLTRVLIGHLKAEDWVLYPSLLETATPYVAEAARQLIHEMGGLADAYNAYTRQWTAQAIAADWEGYRRDSAVVIRMLRKRIAREDRELYPLAERTQRDAA
ncbi:hemerythrin domain-containing protein [Allosphingosinicella sp.]|uniref:hemerythrin domain-containing protein n=1 Tax=Allosphingosinicella sp. TaxID=2823234 RepID=UPI002FC1F020